MLLKVLGSMLVVVCGLVFGLKEKMKFSQKIDVINGIISAIDFIHSEISCMCTPTEELLEKLCKMENPRLNDFFSTCKKRHEDRKDLPFSLIWNRTLKEAKYLELNKSEEETLGEIGNAFGRYSAEEQLRVLICCRKSYDKHLIAAEESKTRLGKLYGGLSFISGIAIVVILL